MLVILVEEDEILRDGFWNRASEIYSQFGWWGGVCKESSAVLWFSLANEGSETQTK